MGSELVPHRRGNFLLSIPTRAINQVAEIIPAVREVVDSAHSNVQIARANIIETNLNYRLRIELLQEEIIETREYVLPIVAVHNAHQKGIAAMQRAKVDPDLFEAAKAELKLKREKRGYSF